MAGTEETIRVLRFDTGEAVTSLADLRRYINETKKSLAELEIGSEEYNAVLKDLQKAQDAMRDSMHFGVEGVVAQKGSYNDLVHTMRELKEQWRATSDEMERKTLGTQINDINSQLKQMDASVGVFSRNVGDYSNKFQEAFVAMGSKAGATAAGGLKQFKLGLDAVSKTPVIAIIGIIVTVLEKLIKTLKGSEAGMQSITKAMGALNGVMELVTKGLQLVADGLAWVINGCVKLAEKLNLVNDRMKEKQALAQAEIQLAKDQRAAMIEEAETERDVAELRAKIAEKEKYTVEQRKGFLQDAIEKEEAIAVKRKALADEELRILEEQNKATKNSAEVEDKIAAAKVRQIQADTNLANTRRKLTLEMNTLLSEEAKNRREVAKAAREEQKAAEAAAKAKLSAEKAYWQELLNIVTDGSKTQFKIKNTIARNERDAAIAEAKARIKDEKELGRSLELIEQTFQIKLAQNRQEYRKKQLDAELLQMQNIRDGYREGSEMYLAEQVAILQREYETMFKQVGESDEAFLARRIAAFKALTLAREEQVEAERDAEILRRQNDMALLEEGSVEYLARSLELKQYELDTMHQLEEESDEEFRARQLEAQKAYNDQSKALTMARVSMMQTAASAVTGLCSGIADAYEALAGDEEKAAEQTKALRIVGATIDTISGAIGAYMSAMTSGIPAPYNMILGAIQAATVTAVGIANIAKLKATNVKGGSSSGGGSFAGASVQAPPVIQQAPVTRSLTSASEDERLDRMASKQRVVLVYSDVQEADAYVEVVQSEAEF